jgi:hypothetical protein
MNWVVRPKLRQVVQPLARWPAGTLKQVVIGSPCGNGIYVNSRESHAHGAVALSVRRRVLEARCDCRGS